MLFQTVIASGSEAIQPERLTSLDCFAALAMTMRAVNSEALGALVEALAEHPLIEKSAVRFAPVPEARFHEVSPGTLTWDWCDRSAAERGLATLAYYDADGQIVSVGLAAAGGQVTEIELWRGDDQPVLSAPGRADLWEMEPGRAYSPRA